MRLKNIIYTSIILIVIILSSSIYFQHTKIIELQEDLSVKSATNKALLLNKEELENKTRTLYLTIDQLNYTNDSILVKINEERKKLKIKDKEIKELQYQLSEATKKDTIVFRDTIFKDSSVKIDTTLQDKWYSLDLKLKYPSTVVVSPKFISEKYVIQRLKKETIDPPKKCWLGRLFQKKHTIIETEIVEKSPYIINKQEVFIKIVK